MSAEGAVAPEMPMLTEPPTYRAVLRTQHLPRSWLSSIVGRFSLATSGLALVLLLEHATESFAIAGTVAATIGVANVAVTPWRARLIDRRGQAAVLTTLSLGYAAALVALGLAPDAGLPTLLCLGVLMGASTPPFATSMRVLWSAALPPGGLRRRGYSLDAVAGELTFAVGPMATAFLAVAVDPLASVLLSACCVLVGAALFVTSPLSRRQVGSRQSGGPVPGTRSPLRSRGFPPLVLMMVAPGMVLGFMDIAAPAVADAESTPVLSGVLLGLFAGASALGGLLYGLVQLRPALEPQLVGLTLALLVVVAATGLAGGAVVALVGFALSGLCLAPGLISGYLAADARADPRARTEANGWMDTAVHLGAALGAALFGTLAETTTPSDALTISATVALAGVVVSAPLLLGSAPGRSERRTAARESG